MTAPADRPAPAADLLQTAFYRALELAQFRGGFLARTAHELRSPLNRIISLQQMILEGLCEDEAEATEFLGEAYAAALKLLEYLDFLIHLSKVEMGRVTPSLGAVSLGSVLQQVEAMTGLQAANRSLRLAIAAPAETAQVWADGAWLQNALTTLIELEIDRCDRGTIALSVEAGADGEHWHLTLTSDRPPSAWHNPLELPEPEPFDLDRPLTADLRLAMATALIQRLGGTLTPVAGESDAIAHLRCTLPATGNTQ